MTKCTACARSTRIIEKIEKDQKTGKSWLIQRCGHCNFNFGLEEYTDKDNAKDHIAKYGESKAKAIDKKYWGTF